VAVTIPSAFARISQGPAGPFGHSQTVGPGLANLLANHNLLFAGQATPIGMAQSAQGWSTGITVDPPTIVIGTAFDLLFRRPPSLHRRPLRAMVYAENSSGTNKTVQTIDGATTASMTVAPGGPAWYSATWTPPDGNGGPVIVQAESGFVSIFFALIQHAPLSGSISDAPLPSWAWTQPAEALTDAPVSTELINRTLAGPHWVQRSQKVLAASVSDSPQAARLQIIDSANQTQLENGSSPDGPHAWILGGLQHSYDARIWVAGRQRFSAVTGEVIVSLAGRSVTLELTGGTATPSPGGPYEWAYADLDGMPAGILQGSITARGAEVFCVHVQSR
jgi:hypothetical protein